MVPVMWMLYIRGIMWSSDLMFTKAFGRVLAPGLIALDLRLPEDVAVRSELAIAWCRLERAIDEFMERQMIAA